MAIDEDRGAPAVPRVLGVRGHPVAMPAYWPPVAVGLLAALLAWIRLPQSLRDTLYAEDATEFVSRWAVAGRVSLLWEPYAGYQHLLPRLGSWAVTSLVAVPYWGIGVTVFACGTVGVIAGLVFACSADVISYLPSRVIAALLTVLIPLAGLEPLGNLANLHWFLLYLTPWLMLAVPRSTLGLWGLTAAMLLATMSEPQSLIFAPLALWQFVSARTSRMVIIAWAVGVAAQAVTFLTAPRPPVPGETPPLLSVIEGYVINVAMPITTSRADLVTSVVVQTGWWIGFAWAAAIVVLAGVGFARGRGSARLMIAALIWGSIAGWSLSFIVNKAAFLYYSLLTPEELLGIPLMRWGTAASMMLAATIPIAIAVLVERTPQRWPAAVVVLSALVVVMLLDLTQRSVIGQHWSDQINAARSVCASDPAASIVVQNQPALWQLTVPCSVIEEN